MLRARSRRGSGTVERPTSCSAGEGKPTRRSCEGMTLIELLVVATIIILLAALLLPVLKTGRDRARQAACASNLKQVHMAFAMYTADFSGYLPVLRESYEEWEWYLWFRSLTYGGYICDRDDAARYLRDAGSALNCPQEPGAYDYQTPNTYRMGYLMNQYAHLQKISTRSATERMLLVDGRDEYSTSAGQLWFQDDFFAYRHTEAVNILYLDGHVGRRQGPYIGGAFDVAGYPVYEGDVLWGRNNW